jgi:hypothetical protein
MKEQPLPRHDPRLQVLGAAIILSQLSAPSDFMCDGIDPNRASACRDKSCKNPGSLGLLAWRVRGGVPQGRERLHFDCGGLSLSRFFNDQ